MSKTRLPFCTPYRLFTSLSMPPNTAGDRIYRAYSRFVFRSCGGSHYLLLAALCVGWPIAFIVMQWMFTRRIGPMVSAATGRAVWRQMLDQLILAIRYGLHPDKYYVFELFRDERRAMARDYVSRHALKGGLHNLFHRRARELPGVGNTKKQLTDKLKFSRRTAQAGIATPQVFCRVTPDGTLHPETHQASSLPPVDIFIKPKKGKGGHGCELWRWESTAYRNADGAILAEPQMRARIADLARRYGPYLVQECLANHPDLAPFGNSLVSLRVTSIRDEHDGSEATHAVLKMSFKPGASTDNFHQGGATAPVEMLEGRLGPAWDSWRHNPATIHPVHPVTGAEILGRRLPFWSDTLKLVKAAHKLFPDRILLGFDVAVTPNGPVILEGNVQSGCDMVQRTYRLPVGRTRLGELLAMHAEQALASPVSRRKLRWFSLRDYLRAR